MSKDAPGVFRPATIRLDAGYFRGDLLLNVKSVSHKTDEARTRGERVATVKQRTAAKRNIKKAAAAAKRKQTLKHLPKKTRIALGKEGAKAAKRLKRKH